MERKKKTMEGRHNAVEQRIKKITKDKNFFESDLTKERKIVYSEFLDEINETGSVRSETLLIFTYVESILKDIISLKLKSKSARDISKSVIVEILEENETLNCYIGADIRKVFDIRNLYAHNLKKSEIEKRIKEIIETMFTTENLKKEFTNNPKAQNWEDRHLSIQLSDIGIKLINHLSNSFNREYIDNATTNDEKVRNPTKF